jgi:hypothetical protein
MTGKFIPMKNLCRCWAKRCCECKKPFMHVRRQYEHWFTYLAITLHHNICPECGEAKGWKKLPKESLADELIALKKRVGKLEEAKGQRAP